MEYKTYTTGVVKTYTAHDAITGDAASSAFEVAGAEKILIVFTENEDICDRMADLTIDVSGDGTHFYDYNMLIDNVTNTDDEQLTRVASVNRSSKGTDLLWMTPETLGAITHV